MPKLALDGKPWSDTERQFAQLTLPAVIGKRETPSSYYADDGFVVETLGRLVDRNVAAST